MTKIEEVARALCGSSLSGYCRDVGGSLGCKVGRGQSFNGTNCAATRDALMLGKEWDMARAAIAAMREPNQRMREAVQTEVDIWPEDKPKPSPSAVQFISGEEAIAIWNAGIDAALAEKP